MLCQLQGGETHEERSVEGPGNGCRGGWIDRDCRRGPEAVGSCCCEFCIGNFGVFPPTIRHSDIHHLFISIPESFIPMDLCFFTFFWINRPEPQPFSQCFWFQRQPFGMAGRLFQVHPGELFYRCHRDGGFNGALRGWENHAAELHGGEKRGWRHARRHHLQCAAAFESSRKHWLRDTGEFGILYDRQDGHI